MLGKKKRKRVRVTEGEILRNVLCAEIFGGEEGKRGNAGREGRTIFHKKKSLLLSHDREGRSSRRY